MKIFLAARYGRRHELRAIAEQLRQLGHQITSGWIDTDHAALEDRDGDVAGGLGFGRRLAMRNIEDMTSADCLICFTEEPGTRHRGDRHLELGMALGWRKQVAIVGPKELPYHHLPWLAHFADLEELLAALAVEAKEEEARDGF